MIFVFQLFSYISHAGITNNSTSQVGTSFTLTGTTLNTLFGSTLTTLTTTLTVIGRDSGARISVPLNIQKVATI